MKITSKTLSLVSIALFSLSTHALKAADDVQTEGAEVGQWTMDFDAAKKLAAEKKLPLMLDFTGSDWCGWCKIMVKNVFTQEDWKKYAAENALLVTIDFPKDKSIVPEQYVERNKELKKQFGVRGYPTYIILDSDGETKIGQLGAGRNKTPESFIAEFENVVRLSDSSIEAYTKANPNKAEAYKAAIAKLKEQKKAFSDWLATRPKKTEENMKKMTDLQQAIKTAEEELAKF